LTFRHGAYNVCDVSQDNYSLTELADASGIEARTIRSYIERGLLPGADARGRTASYSTEHLSRLEVIKALRRARPNIALGEIRILLQELKPEQIRSLAGGSIIAAARAINDSMQAADVDSVDVVMDDDGEVSTTIDWEETAPKLTGAERLVHLLREVSGLTLPAPKSKVEAWRRIVVTPDVELSVRAEFNADQLAAFRDLADLLRYLLSHTDALTRKGNE
jgi:DNA-binding transcriptional MerR regulator